MIVLLCLVFHICSTLPLGNIQTYDEFQREHASILRNEESKRTQVPQHYETSYPVASVVNYRKTKKSDMPEKGQIKFMKTLLGKVKTLLHSNDELPKKEKSEKKKITAYKIPEKIKATTLDSNTNKLYGLLGNGKENDGEKSVNVISIPLNALKKVASSEENYFQRVGKDSGNLERMPKAAQVLLKPMSVQLANNMGDHKEVTSLVPVVLQNQMPRVEPYRSYNVFPDATSNEPFGISRLPFIIDRHGDILKHNKGDEELFKGNKGGEGLYRDIGHIPGEIRYHHTPMEDQDATRRPSLRHRNPHQYHHRRYDDDDDDDDIDDDDEEDDDIDDDDDEEDDDDDDNPYDFRNSPSMRAEEKQIAATRKRLYDMLPGNDPTYTSENRGLGLPMRPGMMQMPEAFLGNPMIQPGAGLNQKTMMPLLGAAMAGEHADNSNDRSVFMFGGQGTKQVVSDSGSDLANTLTSDSTSMRVNSNGFTLGGSHAQAMSPNEVSYMLQKPGIDQLSQKDKITRPRHHKTGSVLLKVNGRPIGDSKELRDHVVNGVVHKGKEKLIKSKGPLDVKVSKATDGVHSKVVDITSADKVDVLEAKSKIAKSYQN